MQRFLPLVISMLIGTAAVAATPIEDVTAQLSKCLKVPPDAPANYRFVLHLQIIDGTVELAAVNSEKRELSAGEIAAMRMIADAATDCEPYGKITSIFDIPVDEKLVNQSK